MLILNKPRSKFLFPKKTSESQLNVQCVINFKLIESSRFYQSLSTDYAGK